MSKARLVGRRAFWVFVSLSISAASSYAQASGSAADKAASDFGLTRLSDDEMTRATGGEEPLSISLASSRSSVTGNQIGGVGATGVVSANSMTGNSGLTTLIANSGNQVVISQSTVVNVFLH